MVTSRRARAGPRYHCDGDCRDDGRGRVRAGGAHCRARRRGGPRNPWLPTAGAVTVGLRVGGLSSLPLASYSALGGIDAQPALRHGPNLKFGPPGSRPVGTDSAVGRSHGRLPAAQRRPSLRTGAAGPQRRAPGACDGPGATPVPPPAACAQCPEVRAGPGPIGSTSHCSCRDEGRGGGGGSRSEPHRQRRGAASLGITAARLPRGGPPESSSMLAGQSFFQDTPTHLGSRVLPPPAGMRSWGRSKRARPPTLGGRLR